MDILNRLSPRRFRTVDDLLAFISIYDDKERTRAYKKLLKSQRGTIAGSVCVEGGCGLALFSIELAHLGAKKVYAVEHNPLLADLARSRVDDLPQHLSRHIEVVQEPLQTFRPPEPVDLLIQELYGQLLYDEDLWVLERLKFKPGLVLPDSGELLAGVVSSDSYCDAVASRDVLRQMKGVLVSGLFEEKLTELRFPVLRWSYDGGLKQVRSSIRGRKGDLLCFGVAVTHKGKRICDAGRCPNWSYVWTPRAGDEFRFRFERSGPAMECYFEWID
jgi:SAM-dependent methyltransferase